MADKALMIQWGAPFVGREQLGLGVFMNAVEYYGKLKAEGVIQDFRLYLNSNGNMQQQQGSMIIEGNPDQITALLAREDYQVLLTKAAHVVDNLNVLEADSGDLIPKRIERLQMVRKELGIS